MVRPAKTATSTAGSSARKAKAPGEPHVQARAGRTGPARRDHLRHALQNQRGQRKDVDEVGEQDDAQGERVGPEIEGPEHGECRHREQRAEDHEADGGTVPDAPQPHPPCQPVQRDANTEPPSRSLHACRPSHVRRPCGYRHILWFFRQANRSCAYRATALLRFYISFRRLVTRISRSVIFLRRVLRLMPSRSAHLAWFPPVASSAISMSGSSTSRRIRW